MAKNNMSVLTNMFESNERTFRFIQDNRMSSKKVQAPMTIHRCMEKSQLMQGLIVIGEYGVTIV